MKSYKKKILVVDDESAMLDMYSLVLEAAGFLVLTANNGKEGLKKAIDQTPDFLLSDISMPGMDGFEMLEKLRKTNDYGKNVPVILLTNMSAGNKEDFITKMAETGPMYYLVKSDLTPDKVVEKVKNCLDNF